MKRIEFRYQLLFGILTGVVVSVSVINYYVQLMTDQGFSIFNWIEDQKIIDSQRAAGWDFFQFYRFYIGPFIRGEFSLNAFSSAQLLKIQPPFMAVILSPFGFLSYPKAYYAHVVCLTLANLFALLIFSRLTHTQLAPNSSNLSLNEQSGAMYARVTEFLSLVIIFLHFLGWGFAYSIEKGNYDAYPMLLMVTGLAMMIYRPNWLWLQVVVFSMATHLKIYPAIMFPLLLWHHRQKALLPLITVNLVMSLAMGWENFVVWVGAVIDEMRNVYSDWPGSSSTGSYVRYMLSDFIPSWASMLSINKDQLAANLKNIINVIVILIWATTSFIALRAHRRLGGIAYLLYLLASLGPMMVIPAYSNPYKLIYMSLPILFMLIIYGKMFVFEGQNFALGVCVGLLLLFGLLSRSQFGFIPNLNTWVFPKLVVYHLAYNKFPLIFLIQLCVLITTFYLYRRSSSQLNVIG